MDCCTTTAEKWVILEHFGKASSLGSPPALWQSWRPTPNLVFWHLLWLAGSIHALKSCCCQQGSLHNNRGKLGDFGIFRESFNSSFASSSVAEVVPHSKFGFWSSLGLVGSIHALKSCCCHQGSLDNNRGKLGNFGIFREGFNSSFASSSVAEVVPHSKFGFLVFSWVGWIHSCTEIMLLPTRILGQQLPQSGQFWDFSGRLQLFVCLQLCGGGGSPLQFWLFGLFLGWLDPCMH